MARSVQVRIQEHFDGISSAYYDIVDRLWYDVGYYHLRESEILRRVLREHPRLAIDAGCGPGRHTVALTNRADRIVAVDISRGMLEQARRETLRNRRGGEADFIQADVRHLPFKQTVADFVLNLEVLEHLPKVPDDVSAALQEFRRVLQPEGFIMTEAPLLRHGMWTKLIRIEGTWKEVTPPEQEKLYRDRPLSANHRFSQRHIETQIKLAGFRIRRRFFVRVLPARLIERFPNLARLDRILEGIPIVQRFAREAIWLVRNSQI